MLVLVTNGISSVAARSRQLEQGAIVTTNSVLCDLVLKHSTGQRNIRLTGSTFAIGLVTDPSLYITDTTVVATKPTTLPSLTVNGHTASNTLTCSGEVTFGNLQCGTIHSSAYFQIIHQLLDLKWEWFLQ